MKGNGQEVEDLFQVFRFLSPHEQDSKFYRNVSEPFDSVEHARVHFPSPDAEFGDITWTKDVHVYGEVPNHVPALTYVAIGQLYDILLLKIPSEAASYINKLRDLRSPSIEPPAFAPNLYLHECSRLRLWAGRGSVDNFDRTYADYPSLESDERSLNGSSAAAKDVSKIVGCLGLSTELFSSLPRQEEEVATIP